MTRTRRERLERARMHLAQALTRATQETDESRKHIGVATRELEDAEEWELAETARDAQHNPDSKMGRYLIRESIQLVDARLELDIQTRPATEVFETMSIQSEASR